MIIITYHTNHLHPHQLFIPSRIHLFIPRIQVPSTANITIIARPLHTTSCVVALYSVRILLLASLAYVSRT
ncbi:hypothetical protein K523DRAFT_74782 [Schizophyllum commune Tattone D]|nr:hypothetical protein K523DRAFT_74782 [Schizophyllum commune Tattone D]